ncbi:MAG: hypothetical protein DRJ05_14340 [Bacteroidetes bacterium]|nr:MAG: hypothetical protein DRJ05_14340 [Bacteroidota bacterium]
MQTEAIKLNLIKYIMEIVDASKLIKMDSVLREISENDEDIYKLVKPMRKRLDVELLKKEQRYKPIDKKKFFKKIKKLEIKEPIEELLAMV